VLDGGLGDGVMCVGEEPFLNQGMREPVISCHRSFSASALEKRKKEKEETNHEPHQPPRSRLRLYSDLRDGHEGCSGDGQLSPVLLHEEGLLFEKGVVGLGEDAEEVGLGKWVEAREDGESAWREEREGRWAEL
jgi:hypothetical protein